MPVIQRMEIFFVRYHIVKTAQSLRTILFAICYLLFAIPVRGRN